MTTVPDAAVDVFRATEAQAWKDAAPITQGEAVEVARAATRAGLETATPLLVAEVLQRLHSTVLGQVATVNAYEGPRSDAADALDWVLQRLDEEMKR
ncbi:hypothetical protein [Dactylosporangium salmoneum]|uniref:Uncharacterized protein n=1 Tax=Dactylosporangium salmoneum TaxID=53361 RepID=A0ABP5T7Z1_9ACTN